MKLLIAFLCYPFVAYTLHAQDIEVIDIPEAVTEIFTLLYSDAKNVTWELVDDKYQASFKNDKKATVAVMDSKGLLFRTETEIKTCALPQEALEYLQLEFTNSKIDYAVIIEDQGGVITFEAIIEKVDFRFDCNGKLLPASSLVSGSGN